MGTNPYNNMQSQQEPAAGENLSDNTFVLNLRIKKFNGEGSRKSQSMKAKKLSQ